MQTQNPLDQLRPNHLPDPVSWWPLAPGWWLSGIALILVVSIIVWALVKYLKKTRYRRLAKQQAHQLYQQYQQHNNSVRFAHECNRLLKKTALHAFPAQDTAKLHSGQWLSFLATTSGNEDFNGEFGLVFGAGKYQQQQTADASQVYALTLSWIKKHHA